MRKSLLGLTLGTMLLGGCYYLPSNSASLLTAATNVARVDLRVSTQVKDGGYRTQGVVTPNTKASIHHLVLKLYKVDAAGVETELASAAKDIAAAQLDEAVTFGGLNVHTHYRLKAFAYRAPGTAEGDVISQDEGSVIDLNVGIDDRIQATLNLRLKDTLFSGTAEAGGVNVTDGGYSDPTESEGMVSRAQTGGEE